MTEKISKNFTSYLLRKEIICDEKVEIVNYLFQIYIEKMVVYMTLFFYGVYREKIVELFFFLIMYTNLRKYTGGFHAQNFFRCYIGSVTVVVIGLEVFVSMTYTQNLFVSVIYIIAVFIISIIGTVNHPNMDFTKIELVKSKKCARGVIMLETLFIICLIMFHVQRKVIVSACYGVILCAMLLILSKIQKQEVQVDETGEKTKGFKKCGKRGDY